MGLKDWAKKTSGAQVTKSLAGGAVRMQVAPGKVTLPKVGVTYRHKHGDEDTITSADQELVKFKRKDGSNGVTPAWIFASLIASGDYKKV